VYSDEVFKEQNAIIEDKLMKASLVKEDASFKKYNIDEVIGFLKTMLADLGETYKKSSVSQIKVLLGFIFPSGLAWNYDGTWNRSINPIYQTIISFSKRAIPLGAGNGSRTRVSTLAR
jgi:hypothetical protein